MNVKLGLVYSKSSAGATTTTHLLPRGKRRAEVEHLSLKFLFLSAPRLSCSAPASPPSSAVCACSISFDHTRLTGLWSCAPERGGRLCCFGARRTIRRRQGRRAGKQLRPAKRPSNQKMKQTRNPPPAVSVPPPQWFKHSFTGHQGALAVTLNHPL